MATFQIGDKLVYHGAAGAGVMYGENCRVVELLPHGTYSKNGVTCDPQPSEFDPKLDRFIGDWLRAESTDEDGLRFTAPQNWFHAEVSR